METSLHRQLKALYSSTPTDTEVVWGRYRIDAIRDGELIEIQHGSLASIRGKINALLVDNRVRVVKPIVARKVLVKRVAKGKRVWERRLSPKRGTVLDMFRELVYFCKVFPHPNLTLEVPLVELEEWRYPGHGRRRWRRPKDHQVEDQKLVALGETHEFRDAQELLRLLPADLPKPFGTSELANACRIDVGFARQIAYCLRETGAVEQTGKRGNALLYAPTTPAAVAKGDASGRRSRRASRPRSTSRRSA